MKHPSFKLLQDYSENECSEQISKKVRLHLSECDKCSDVLSEMAKVDVFFSKHVVVETPEYLKAQVFSKAQVLLEQKREILHSKELKKEKRKEQVTEAISLLESLKNGALSEFKIPAMQTAAISLFLIVLTKVATTETYIEYNQLINDDVQVINSELLGDENEVY